MSFIRASEVLPPLQNIITIVNNPGEINGVIEIKLKELDKKYKWLLLAAIVDHHEYEEDNIARSNLPTGFSDASIPRYIVCLTCCYGRRFVAHFFIRMTRICF